MAAAGDYDYAAALRELDESRAGVRGLVESGITAVPPLFRMLPDLSPQPAYSPLSIPTIDLSLPRSTTVPLIAAAARTCGFFQVTNHGVPVPTIDAAISAVRSFNEQPPAARSAFYAREPVGGVCHYINLLSENQAPHWCDTLQVHFGAATPDLGRLPPPCRDALSAYHVRATAFGKEMVALLSEGLGVGKERLEQATHVGEVFMACHYYPPCPEPEWVLGARAHTDASTISVLAQDGVGGLQVRFDGGGWDDVQPVPGALVVNVGDFLKVVSNDEYMSIEHRVVIKSLQDARVSIALFFNPFKYDESDLFGPLPELVTTKKPAVYRSFTMPDYLKSRREFAYSKASIDHFRIAESYDQNANSK